jgi:hypothetical protein
MPPARLERATHSLEGCCSIQLSYGSTKRATEMIARLAIAESNLDNCFYELDDQSQEKSNGGGEHAGK